MLRALLTVFLLFASTARADDDYDTESLEWNGLGQLVTLGNEIDVHVERPTRVDVGALTPNDALLIVYPTRELPVSSLAAFMRAGGRLALADDFGRGDDLLQLYGIERLPADEEAASRLRNNDALLVARPTSRHPLTAAVSALVTNHPTLLAHDELEPVFGFDRPGRALVLAGAVGEGRLVALGDPSVLINNMQEFEDDRRFATNLLRYLSGNRGGRLLLVTRDTPIVGRFGEPGADRRFHDVRQFLEKLAKAELPPVALKLLAIALATILLVVALTTLPRKSPYDGANMFARPPSSGGFVGRVEFFKRRPGDMLQPLMVYKFELEGELVRALGLGGRALLRDVMDALRERGMDEREVQSVRALLLELNALRDRQDAPPAPPKVSAAKFRQMVDAGRTLLETLAALPTERPRAVEDEASSAKLGMGSPEPPG